jgi:histidyl-tRNA synthetase
MSSPSLQNIVKTAPQPAPKSVPVQRLQAVKGMHDLLPQHSALWQFFEDTTRRVFEAHGYQLMRTPIVEPTPLFARSIGEVTDIVEKEMYSFLDSMNGDALTLRPEATAGLVRAAVEHSLLREGPKRIWTFGPMFRHERPQKGRLRQFHQFDVEAMGYAGPDVDAEQIVMLARLWRALGLSAVRLEINSIGDVPARQAHRAALVAYFEANEDKLDEDAKRRLHTNPLRTLDTKNPAMQSLVDAAPKLADYLDDVAKVHFLGVTRRLDAAGVAYTVNPRLVRGFDYYNRTVFEFIGKGADWELTIGGGGRYDGLCEQLGGKPAPSCGFGIGAERVMLMLEANPPATLPAVIDAYFIYGEGLSAAAFAQAEALRNAGLRVVLHANADGTDASFKSQMKKADASGARFAIIRGTDEAAADVFAVKNLQDGTQQSLSFDALVSHVSAA